MAAYGALVCAFNTLEQIKQHLVHARLPISVDREQIESLSEKTSFLIDFLECYYFRGGSSNKVKPLEDQIRDAACGVRDEIQFNVGLQLLFGSTTQHEESSSSPFYETLQKLIEELDSIKKKAVEIDEEESARNHDASKSNLEPPLQHQSQVEFQSSLTEEPTASDPAKNKSVGFNEYLIQIMELLMGHNPNLETIPIVGMAGIGKTTLARNAYDNRSSKEYFDLRAWVAVSQEYSVRRVLSILLYSIKEQKDGEGLEAFITKMSNTSEDKMGREFYQSLFGRRYLIVLDDVWTVKAWDEVNRFFPDSGNGSRIVITTRLSNIASHFGSRNIEVELLDDDVSWSLLRGKVFAGKGDRCPPELIEIGKKISKNCRGLPLSLVIVGGLLAKSKRSIKYWEYIAEHVDTEIINSQNDGHCLKILSLSYNQLPVQVKPCFIYMGAFPEDHEINVSKLIKLWVANGFLKPSSEDKSLEEVGMDCVKELIDRNLILVRKRGSSQNVKTCMVHDLLRDLCLRKAQEENFEYLIRRLGVIPKGNFLQENFRYWTSDVVLDLERPIGRQSSKDLVNKVFGRGFYRILKEERNDLYPPGFLLKMINLSYLEMICDLFYPSLSMLWNLQTLIFRNFWITTAVAPSKIWEMTQLRHIKFDSVSLPDPPSGRENCVLKNLQTLLRVRNFKCSEEVLKKIPNIKKLEVSYTDFSSSYCLNNLVHLGKLESLSCKFWPESPNRNDLLPNIAFPNSLKRLTLEGSNLHWDDMAIIGSLPNLEVLKLGGHAFIGKEWDSIEGGFSRLKLLEMFYCGVLTHWRADASHFPSLYRLALYGMVFLEEIPSEIGEIPTLGSIVVQNCNNSTVISAMNIAEYQLDCGNEDLQVDVFLEKDTKLEISSTKNFIVHRK